MCRIKNKVYVTAIVSVLTFGFGIGIVFLTFQNTKPTSLCAAIKNNLSQLNSKGRTNIHLKGYLTGGGEFLSFSDVNRNDCEDSYADIVITDKGKLSNEAQTIIEKMSHLTNENNLARVKVEIVGTLEEQPVLCVICSRYFIRAIQIMPETSIQVIDHSALAKEARESR